MSALGRFLARDRPVLLLMVLASLTAHGMSFWLVRIGKGADVTGWSERPRVHLLQPAFEEGAERDYLYLLAERMDPSLLSLPSPHGFSRALWARAEPTTTQALDWRVPPAPLEIAPAPVVATLLPPTPLPATLQAGIEKPLVTDTVPVAGGEPVAPSGTRSALKLAGGLAERAVLRAPALPAVPHLGGLRRTVVRVGVTADGVVQHALLDRGSGSEVADQQALALVRQVRFQPLAAAEGTGLTWGQAHFYWATSAPAAEGGS